MKYGPLAASPDAIAVASIKDLHIRATLTGIAHHRGATQLTEQVPWSQVADVALQLPASRFPYPGAMATAGYALLALLSQQVEDIASEESTVTVTLTSGERVDLPVDHAIGGYWTRAITNAETLIRQLIEHPEQRALLAHPEEIIHRYANATRWHTRLEFE